MSRFKLLHVLCASLIPAAMLTGAARAEQGEPAVYQVEHSVAVRDLPAGARNVRLWFWMPNDDAYQRTHSFTIERAPDNYLIIREPTTGSRFLYADVDLAEGQSPVIVTRFHIERREARFSIDPATVGPITDRHRAELAEFLAADTPHMQVTARVRQIAERVCGDETNPYLQALKIYNYVVEHSDHYSKGGDAPKSSGIGSAEYCLDLGGGGCTDQHSLFIALARARGIPARIEFGSRLQPRNEGNAVDPGYRCWVEYLVPNHGWVCMDAAAGDTVEGKRDFYAQGLDNQRIRFATGRNLDLGGGERLNLLIGAYVEVDGKPHEGFDRRMTFRRVRPAQTLNAHTEGDTAS